MSTFYPLDSAQADAHQKQIDVDHHNDSDYSEEYESLPPNSACSDDVFKENANAIENSSPRTEATAAHVNDNNYAGQTSTEAPKPTSVVLETEQIKATAMNIPSLAKAPESAADASKQFQLGEVSVQSPSESPKPAGSMEGHATTPLLAEAKAPAKSYRESKKAQAKRQRAAREAAYREAASPIGQNGGVQTPINAWEPRPRIPIKADMPYYVAFSVRLGSAVHRRIFFRTSGTLNSMLQVSLKDLDSNLRNMFAEQARKHPSGAAKRITQVAAALGVCRSVISIQGARQSLQGDGCILETRVGVRDSGVARALGATISRAPPLLVSGDEAKFGDAQYLAVILVSDGNGSTSVVQYQMAQSEKRIAAAASSAAKPRVRSSTGDADEEQCANCDHDDGFVRTREVATQCCGNHAGVQADLRVPG